MTGRTYREKLCRTALHVLVSVFVIGIPALGAAPAAHAAAASATLVVEHTWQDGFIARFSITNASMAPLTDWRLEFDMPVGQTISHAWNSTVSQSGTHYIVSPANWNRSIAPGASATGGFRGVLSGTYSPPSNCQLNRQVVCT